MYTQTDLPINKDRELSHLYEWLNLNTPTHSKQTKEKWNERALHWKTSLLSKTESELNTPRISKLVEFLETEGALNNSTSVLDVGSGVGIIAYFLAKKAKRVTALDFSNEMCKAGSEWTASKNQQNVDFLECDFNTLDVATFKSEHKANLVFTALSPSIKNGGLTKCLSLTSRYFCNEGFVHREFDLYEKIKKDVFFIKKSEKITAYWPSFYAMVNILFLEGFYPRITYIEEKSEKKVALSEKLIDDVVFFIAHSSKFKESHENRAKIENYLKKVAVDNKDGLIPIKERTVYGVALVDITKKEKR